MLEVRELTVEVSGRAVVREASFSVRVGDKVGLVGRNGAGKTSLLRVLSGETTAASGVALVAGAMGYVPQDPRPRARGAETTALAHVLSGRDLDRLALVLHHAQRAMEKEASEANVHAFSEAEEAFREAGGYQAEGEVRRITAGLGLQDERVDLELKALSGGESRRVEIARVLFAGSDLLLLDEPTNHLDKAAKEWLMGFLRAHRGGLLVVSHDLDLLDSAITRVLHLDEGRVIPYRGTYSQYLSARKRDEERLGKTAERQQAEIKRLTTLADVMRRQTAKRAKTAHSIDKRVERMRAVMVTGPKRERKIKIRFPEPPHAGRIVLHANGLTKSYGGPRIFDTVSFELTRGERLLVMGFNGAGKTSLLRILAGESEPDSGSFRLGAGVSAGYYAQQHEGIDPAATVLDHMYRSSDEPEPQLRSLVGMFGLTGDIARQKAGTLSGGEKTKLALAQLVAGRHNLLLLDEPTNNLDPPSRTAVAVALAAWPGTMILVSHDPEFVEALAPTRILLMPEGRVDYWEEELLGLVSMA